jgi:NAD-dependent deacetylase
MKVPDLPLDRFEHIVFFTGAGLSAECGLPTYRGKGGIWSSYNYEDYACQRAFDVDPERVWEFHDERRRMMAAVDPGVAHRMIAHVQAQRPGTRVVTQNIDGLHQRAGAEHVIELHGSVWRVRCECSPLPSENHDLPIERRCTACDAYKRPDIVWFEDPMQKASLEAAVDALSGCDLLISIGTSGVVFPAAQLPAMAQVNGALCVEINPEETPVSHLYAEHLRAGASESLAALWPDVAAACA